jgi:hypothetical protein
MRVWVFAPLSVVLACGLSLDGTPTFTTESDGGPPEPRLDAARPQDATVPPKDAPAAMLDAPGPDAPLTMQPYVPSNTAYTFASIVSTSGDFPASTDTIDTTANTPTGTIESIASREVMVLIVNQFVPSKKLLVTGTRPLLILANEVSIEFPIDAGAHFEKPGPGAFNAGSLLATASWFGQLGTQDGAGGGGGYATNGAKGGDGATKDTGGLGGVAWGGSTSLLKLLGGVSGASGFDPAGCTTSKAGGGGGIVQISARNRISITSTITVGGGGGGAGCLGRTSGGGGGSGGKLVLESPMLVVAGFLASNGGGGGGGGSETTAGGDGNDGTSDGLRSNGGLSGGSTTARSGGRGGISAASGAPVGGLAETNTIGAGGGGGAAGRIVLRIPASNPAVTLTSPPAVRVALP